MEGDTMKIINLCSNEKCCPKLVVIRNKKMKFKITDDNFGEVNLTESEGRNLALAILNEVKE